ncbi:NUDIX domain-containing protein [Gemmatimonadota bacterium Y43]|uniref:NUDIX domain-containing protein n=1 Tax=Gaopeijia maritima TaxID=3119007 RepID=UPI0032700473
MLSKGIGSGKPIFVAHSLGGIVAKSILRKSHRSRRERLNCLFNSVEGVCFLATPHKGSPWADVLNSINTVMPFVRASERIDELAHDNESLESLSAWYRDVTAASNLETMAFYEQRRTKNIMVVPHYSANPDVVDCDPIPVPENHIEIAKPSRKDAVVYAATSGLLGYVFRDAEPEGEYSVPPQTIVIGVVTNGDKVLMVERRHPVNNLTWQFVTGRLKSTEEVEYICLEREVKEEANVSIDLSTVRRLGEATDGSIPYKRVYYACEYLDGAIENTDPNENVDVRWVPRSQIRQYATTPIHPIVEQFLRI